ncbi:MAG: 30S ribosomal protein S15 [Elusimicrobiota bacterium]|nr:30S ribosomal protein S15 [Elusimicrobiota bacterium]
MLTKEQKKEIIEKYKIHPTDTGSTPVTIAILTERIKQLTEHFKKFPKDFLSRRGFLKLINRRRRLLNCLKKQNKELYKELINKLEV